MEPEPIWLLNRCRAVTKRKGSMADIGNPVREIEIEPLEEPVPTPAPVEEPEREPEHV